MRDSRGFKIKIQSWSDFYTFGSLGLKNTNGQFKVKTDTTSTQISKNGFSKPKQPKGRIQTEYLENTAQSISHKEHIVMSQLRLL